MSTSNLKDFLGAMVNAIQEQKSSEMSINGQSFVREIEGLNPEGLPVEYQRIQYVESTKTQCFIIKSDYILQSSDSVECKYYIYDDNTEYATIIGSTNFKIQKEYFRLMSNRATSVSSPTNAVNIMKYDGSLGYLNDTLVKPSGTRQSTSTNLVLFADQAYGNKVRARIYSFTLSDVFGKNKINLIPCYRKFDGIIGMYDTVNRIFFQPTGTGDLIAGPDAN